MSVCLSVGQVPFDDGISVSKGNEANGACKLANEKLMSNGQ